MRKTGSQRNPTNQMFLCAWSSVISCDIQHGGVVLGGKQRKSGVEPWPYHCDLTSLGLSFLTDDLGVMIWTLKQCRKLLYKGSKVWVNNSLLQEGPWRCALGADGLKSDPGHMKDRGRSADKCQLHVPHRCSLGKRQFVRAWFRWSLCRNDHCFQTWSFISVKDRFDLP